MKIPPIKTPASVEEALRIQQDMRQHVEIEDNFGKIKTIAGIDVGYDLQKNMSKAALVLMDIDSLVPINFIVEFDATPFPYVPGLLSFREAPVILKALSKLKDAPDILFIDGQGIAHPRRLGIASHIGVLMDMPSVGIAKSVLCGRYEEPSLQKGSMEPLVHKGKKIATAYRSREKVKPIFISPGHKIGHESAVKLVARCLTKYRLPEPTRIADKLSKTGAATLLL